MSELPQNQVANAEAVGSPAVGPAAFNTYVQFCDIAANLRTFVGKAGMTVILQGIASVGDGLGGTFYWSATSTAADDNLNTIAPNGPQGRWLRLTVTGANLLTLGGQFTTTGAFSTTFVQTASATYTLDGVNGTIAQTSGANLNITDIRRCPTIQTANTNVVPANITGLSGAVAVGTYDFEATLYCTVASGTAGIAIFFALTTAVLGVANFTAKGFLAAGIATQATTDASGTTALFTAADQPLEINVKGTFTVTTAGTFGLQMCQNTSNASNSSVNVGSTMRLSRIA